MFGLKGFNLSQSNLNVHKEVAVVQIPALADQLTVLVTG